MKIVIDLTHPGHVHFFKNAYKTLLLKGHEVLLVARDKDITLQLLQDYGFPYQVLSKKRNGIIGLSSELVLHEIRLIRIAKKYKPDLILEIGGTFIVHAAKLLNIKSIVFTDTEHAKVSNSITFPFATTICTPESYHDDLGKKQLRFNGYKELAYLHPNQFTPDKSVLTKIGLNENDRFFILRFISWGASHDIGQTGLADDEKIALVDQLNPYGKVFITSEGDIPEELEPYQLDVSPTYMHDLLYYASMYIGEGATMASEAAVLGTPSVYINPLSSGNIEEIKNKYHLMHHFPSKEGVIEKIVDMAADTHLKERHRQNRQVMLHDKIDVTAWMVDLIEADGENPTNK